MRRIGPRLLSALAVGVVFATPALADGPVWLLDGTFAGSTLAPVALDEPGDALWAPRPLALWSGFRGGALFPLGGPFVAGGDIGLMTSWEAAGTRLVGEQRLLFGVEPRALVGAQASLGPTRVLGYGFVGGLGAIGGKRLILLEEERTEFSWAGGGRIGLGFAVGLGAVRVRVDNAIGVREHGLEVATTLGLGVAIE